MTSPMIDAADQGWRPFVRALIGAEMPVLLQSYEGLQRPSHLGPGQQNLNLIVRAGADMEAQLLVLLDRHGPEFDSVRVAAIQERFAKAATALPHQMPSVGIKGMRDGVWHYLKLSVAPLELMERLFDVGSAGVVRDADVLRVRIEQADHAATQRRRGGAGSGQMPSVPHRAAQRQAGHGGPGRSPAPGQHRA